MNDFEGKITEPYRSPWEITEIRQKKKHQFLNYYSLKTLLK